MAMRVFVGQLRVGFKLGFTLPSWRAGGIDRRVAVTMNIRWVNWVEGLLVYGYSWWWDWPKFGYRSSSSSWQPDSRYCWSTTLCLIPDHAGSWPLILLDLSWSGFAQWGCPALWCRVGSVRWDCHRCESCRIAGGWRLRTTLSMMTAITIAMTTITIIIAHPPAFVNFLLIIISSIVCYYSYSCLYSYFCCPWEHDIPDWQTNPDCPKTCDTVHY